MVYSQSDVMAKSSRFLYIASGKRNYCSSLDNIACSWIKPSACYYLLHARWWNTWSKNCWHYRDFHLYRATSCSISMVCETMHASYEATVAQWFGCQPVLQKILVRFHACMHAVFNILGSLKVSKNPFGFIPVLTCIMTTQSK